MTSASREAFRDAEHAIWDLYKASPRERLLDLPGGPRVRVQEIGEGPPALFVHGPRRVRGLALLGPSIGFPGVHPTAETVLRFDREHAATVRA